MASPGFLAGYALGWRDGSFSLIVSAKSRLEQARWAEIRVWRTAKATAEATRECLENGRIRFARSSLD